MSGGSSSPTQLGVAWRAALAGGEALLALRASVLADGAAATKSSGTDPVTRADVAAQDAIAGVILAARPDDGLIGEEGLSRPGGTGWSWIIDPLDGTVNYLYGRDEWAVSIAARDAAGAAVAVVHAPALSRTCTAVRGEGAWLYGTAGVSRLAGTAGEGPAGARRAGGGTRLRVRGGADLPRAVVGTGFSYRAERRAAQAQTLRALLPRIADIRRGGSAALDLAAVASGALDAFYEDDLEVWDWAAGALIAVEAGAVVSELSGPDGHGGLLAAAPALHDALLALVRPGQ